MVNRQGFLSEYILQIYQLINSLRLIWAFLYSRLVWSVYRKIAMANRSLCIFDNLRDISEEFRPFKRFHNKNEYRSYFNVPLSEILMYGKAVSKFCTIKKWEKIVYFSKSFNPLSFISITSSWKSERYIFGQRIFLFQMCILDITGNIYYIYPRNL